MMTKVMIFYTEIITKVISEFSYIKLQKNANKIFLRTKTTDKREKNQKVKPDLCITWVYNKLLIELKQRTWGKKNGNVSKGIVCSPQSEKISYHLS